jgi:AraC-like DNA-binding protein
MPSLYRGAVDLDMAPAGGRMHFPTMETGVERVTPLEDLLQTLQLHVAVSRRQHLAAWSYELSSPFWRLYANNRSGAHVTVAGRRLELRPGRLYLIPAGVAFRTGLERPVVHDFIHFYLSGFPRSLHDRLFPAPLSVPFDPLLRQLQRRWRECLDDGVPRDWTTFGWASALAHAAFATAARTLGRADREACQRWLTQAKEVRPALNAIEESMASPPDNATLAARCSLSETHFIRTFRRAVGVTPARYGLERRLAVAAGQLVGSSRPIETIAAATGFTDRFHFSRSFKRSFGVAPAAYRRMHRHGS